MKTQILFLLFVVGVCAAQTNFDSLVCGGITYSNATIIRATPAYVVVDYSAGIVKVSLTNLPASLQKKYNYDPDAARAELGKEKAHALAVQKQKLDYQKYLARLRGTNRVVKIKTILDSMGQCQTSVGKIYLLDTPKNVSAFFIKRTQLVAQLYDLKHRRIVVTATANNTGDETFDSSLAAQSALYDAQESRRKSIEDTQSDLDDLNASERENTTVIAYPTGLSNYGIPQYQCVEMKPDE